MPVSIHEPTIHIIWRSQSFLISAGIKGGIKGVIAIFLIDCNVSGWRDIVTVAVSGYNTVGLRAVGTVVAVGFECEEVGNWRGIGPVPEEKIWKRRGLCCYCGGSLSGLFTKKYKSCGKENCIQSGAVKNL